VLEKWQNKCINGVYDNFWSVHGRFNGVFQFIRDRVKWNGDRCRKKSGGYWELTAPSRFSYLHAAGFASLVPEYQEFASRFPLVPAMVWGAAVPAAMERQSRGDAERAEWAQWWPHIINPWNMSSGTANCVWGLCVENAITKSRPWQIHTSRVQILSADAPQACLPTPGPIIEEIVAEEDGHSIDEEQATNTEVEAAPSAAATVAASVVVPRDDDDYERSGQPSEEPEPWQPWEPWSWHSEGGSTVEIQSSRASEGELLVEQPVEEAEAEAEVASQVISSDEEVVFAETRTASEWELVE
jgi:hypothetical protein